MEAYANQSTQPAGDGWVSEKPEWKEECILLTASLHRGDWNYSAFEVKEALGEDEQGNNAWYWALCCLEDGEEWGDINDLSAQWYKIISPLPAPPKS
jgi:hypothetical protein